MTETPDVPADPAPQHPTPPAPPQEHPTVALPVAAQAAEPWAAPSARRTDGTAVLALVLAVVSWVTLPVLLAVVALLLARSAERAIAGAPQELGGAGLVRAARWVAWVQLLVVAMAAAFLGAFFLALWVAG